MSRPTSIYPLCVYPVRFALVSHAREAVRATMLDDKMVVRTHLLAVKLFRPDPSFGGITGEVVLKWVRQVLVQHHIGDEDVIGAVTGSGADVRRGVGGVWPWEGCLAHLLNGATIDGTGMSRAKERSKNLLCRELLELIEETVEYFDKSSSDEV